MGITTSAPYIIEKGVSPVEHRGMVRYAHNTLKSSSAHQPFKSSSLFFRPFTMDLLVAST